LWPQYEGGGRDARGSAPSLCSPPPIPHTNVTAFPPVNRPCLHGTTATPLELCLDLGVGYQAHGSREESITTPEGGDRPPDSADSPATSSIELIASSSVSGGRLWLQKRLFVCVRQTGCTLPCSSQCRVPSPLNAPPAPPPSMCLPPPRVPFTCLSPSRSLLTCLPLPLFFPPLQTGHNSLQYN
jgi:hypothetical protein